MNRWLHGLHCAEPSADGLCLDWDGKRPGTRMLVKAIGHNRDDYSGDDFSALQAAGFRVMVRLGVDWSGGGCIPEPPLYLDFAARAAHYVAASPGIGVVIIGNEMNHAQEWPHGQPITPHDYGTCFSRCYQTIKAVAPEVQVCVGAVAPYNNQGTPENWIAYHMQVLESIPTYDAVAIHAYNRQCMDPAGITAQDKMGAPFEAYSNGFQVYKEWMAQTPDDVPVYLTEFNPLCEPEGWHNANTGVIREMYCEIDSWNQEHPRRRILAALCYRTTTDEWAMQDKANVREDYEQAVAIGYTVDAPEPPEEEPPVTTINDGFENGFHWFNGDGHLEIPEGWGVAWVEGDKPGPVRPECKYELKGRDQGIRSGEYGSKIAHSYSFFDAVLYRDFAVPRGVEVTASVYTTAESEGLLACQVGIDPEGGGGGDFQDPDIVWGEWWGTGNSGFESYEWQQIASTVVAQSDQVTVFLRCKCDNPVHTNAGFFDDFALTYEGEPPEPPPEPPPANGTIQEYIGRIRADVDALEAFVQTGTRRCILVE